MIISNNFYTIALNDQNGAIMSLKNMAGKEFISHSEGRDLFELWMLDEQGERVRLSANTSEYFGFGNSDENTTELLYRNVGGKDIDVYVIVRHPEGDNLMYWSMSLKNHSEYHLDKIDFPKVTVPNDLIATGGTGRILSSMMEGVIIEDLKIREGLYLKHEGDMGYPARGWEGSYPGACPMQFMAYYCAQGGLYFAAHDKDCNPKVVEFCRDGDGIKLEFQLFPGQDDTVVFSYGYEMVLGVFDGDWYDAAEIYRSFIEQSGIVTLPKLKKNKDVPAWLKESPIVVCYPVRGEVDSRFEETTEYYPYTKATPYIKQLQEDLDSAMMPLLMHWEGTAPWAPPYVWPPFGDFANFEQYITDMHESGNYIGVYCSGIAWTQRSALLKEYTRELDFERDNIKDIVVRGPKGVLEHSRICGGVGWRYDMCPACEKTKQIAATEFEKIIVNCEVDYVQFFDQNLGGGAYPCYVKSHGHNYGAGKWKNEAMLQLTDRMMDVLEQCGKKNKVLIGCEANAAEPFINRFIFNDSRFNINYMFGSPVPAYNYVFHEYVNNFMGNQNTSYGTTDFAKYPENIYFRLAHSFVQGDVLTIVLKDQGKIHWDWCTPWSEPEIDQVAVKAFIREMNAWRKNVAKPSLQFGRMVKPFKVECGVYHEDICNYGEHNYASVETCCYEVGKNKKQQILVNFLPYEQTIIVHTKGKTTLIEDYLGTVRSSLDESEKIILPPRSVRMIEIED